MQQAIFWVISLCMLLRPAVAQSPSGMITGVVRDSSGAVMAGVQVRVASPATGLERYVPTSADGRYDFPVLSAGEYLVSAQFPGFQETVRTVFVEAGVTTASDFVLLVGEVTESVAV